MTSRVGVKSSGGLRAPQLVGRGCPTHEGETLPVDIPGHKLIRRESRRAVPRSTGGAIPAGTLGQ